MTGGAAGVAARVAARVAIDRGDGPPVVLLHGSGVTSATWVFQVPALSRSLRVIAVDRTPGVSRVADHVGELAATLENLDPGPVTVCGSSFGSIIGLELARARPELVSGAVLCEPPLPPGDRVPPVPVGFGCEFDRRARVDGPLAGAFFLRGVLGDAAFEAIPEGFRERACATWLGIRDDSAALLHHRVRYGALSDVACPVLLLGGDRSLPMFGDTLDTLERAIPGARRVVIAGAGHMAHVDAAAAFNRCVVDFVSGL